MKLRDILENYVQGVSRSKLHINSHAIDALKTLDYHAFIAVIQQFESELCCVCVNDYIQLSTTDIMKAVKHSNYKDYPVTIKQVSQDITELIAASPMSIMDTLICLPTDGVLFAPVVAESISRDCRSPRRLHEMTLVFDTQNNSVFLHDPNGRSLFNDEKTHTLLRSYVDALNRLLAEYGLVPFKYDVYEFCNMNTKVKHIFSKSVTGNCVIASMVFMLLYHQVRDASILKSDNHTIGNKDYTPLYTAFYNKIDEYLTLTGIV
jgi:hypothetical protein